MRGLACGIEPLAPRELTLHQQRRFLRKLGSLDDGAPAVWRPRAEFLPAHPSRLWRPESRKTKFMECLVGSSLEFSPA